MLFYNFFITSQYYTKNKSFHKIFGKNKNKRFCCFDLGKNWQIKEITGTRWCYLLNISNYHRYVCTTTIMIIHTSSMYVASWDPLRTRNSLPEDYNLQMTAAFLYTMYVDLDFYFYFTGTVARDFWSFSFINQYILPRPPIHTLKGTVAGDF